MILLEHQELVQTFCACVAKHKAVTVGEPFVGQLEVGVFRVQLWNVCKSLGSDSFMSKVGTIQGTLKMLLAKKRDIRRQLP